MFWDSPIPRSRPEQYTERNGRKRCIKFLSTVVQKGEHKSESRNTNTKAAKEVTLQWKWEAFGSCCSFLLFLVRRIIIYTYHTGVHPAGTERHHGSVWVHGSHHDRVHIIARDSRHVAHALSRCGAAGLDPTSACHLGREVPEGARGPPWHTQYIIEARVKPDSRRAALTWTNIKAPLKYFLTYLKQKT